MKRLWLCFFVILTLLSGCGKPEPADPVSVFSAAVQGSAPEGTGFPAEWTETELENGDVGYVTALAEVFRGYDSVSIQHGDIIGRKTEEERLTVARLDPDGSVLQSAVIPAEDPLYWGVLYPLFGEASLWAVEQRQTIVDEETGQVKIDYTLKNWDNSGKVLLEIPLDHSFPWANNEEEAPFPVLQMMDSQGRLLLKTEKYLYALDQTGTVVDTLDFMDTHYEMGQDSAGRIYLADALDTKQAYLLDQETLEVGAPLFPVKMGQQLLPGGGEYELYLLDSGKLVGVDMDTGTLTTLVKWVSMGLVDAVNGAICLDEGALLLATMDVTIGGSQMLTLRQMPLSEIPEKEIVRVAYMLDDPAMAENMTSGTAPQHAMNKFNRENSRYQVEFAYYTGTTELQMEILAGNSPDIILFGTNTEDYPSEQVFSRSGMLVDLEDLIHADPELSMEDFLPNVITAMKDSNGGLYTLPITFYFRTMTASREYVGDMTAWTVSDIYDIAKTLPEDMVVFGTQDGLLEYFLQHNINQYVDMENLTCDFTGQDFYDLLTLARDYTQPAVNSEMNWLIGGVASMGSMANFASDLMKLEESTLFLGFPGAPGNGGDLVMMECMGILATAQQPEGAWEFLRTLYLPEIQAFASGMMFSIRQDVFFEENRFFVQYSDCTVEEMEAAEELVLGACSRTVYDNPAIDIVIEEAQSFFAGDKSAEQVAEIIENRVKIYLWEQAG